MIYDLIVLGHPRLRQRCYNVTDFGEQLVETLGDMRDTMRAARGVGLAAPQVDLGLRIAVIELDKDKIDLINPVVEVIPTGKILREEGCLSIPDVFADVTRHESINLTTHDPMTGEPKRYRIDGFLARAIQHEVDHLNGRLFIDHLGEYKRKQALNSWAKQAKQYPNCIYRLG